MRWPWSRTETRSGGYSDAQLLRLLAAAEGKSTTADPSATAALEAASGAVGRAFATAEIQPAVPALDPTVLHEIGRSLIRHGELVFAIDVDRDTGLMLQRASDWSVAGRYDEMTWTYRATFSGPTRQTTRTITGAGVVHPRYATHASEPHRGLSPLEFAAATGRLLGAAEDALADEAGGPRGTVIPVPSVSGSDDDENVLAGLSDAIRRLGGSLRLVETVAAAWGEGRGQAPQQDWTPKRIGAAPPSGLISLRSDAAVAVLAACGCPPDLFSAGGQAASRESFRRFLHATIVPLSELVLRELRVKLDMPDLRFNFDRLFASDLAGRARAFGSMVNGGLPLEQAAALSGLLVDDSD